VACSSGLVSERVFSTTIAASLISIALNVFIARAAFSCLTENATAESQLISGVAFGSERLL
jgi:hypothetical protein